LRVVVKPRELVGDLRSIGERCNRAGLDLAQRSLHRFDRTLPVSIELEQQGVRARTGNRAGERGACESVEGAVSVGDLAPRRLWLGAQVDPRLRAESSRTQIVVSLLPRGLLGAAEKIQQSVRATQVEVTTRKLIEH